MGDPVSLWLSQLPKVLSAPLPSSVCAPELGTSGLGWRQGGHRNHCVQLKLSAAGTDVRTHLTSSESLPLTVAVPGGLSLAAVFCIF